MPVDWDSMHASKGLQIRPLRNSYKNFKSRLSPTDFTVKNISVMYFCRKVNIYKNSSRKFSQEMKLPVKIKKNY